MKNYSINIFSEMPLQFGAGNVYLVQSMKVFTEKEQLSSDNAFYLNYPFNAAVKIIPFYDNLDGKDRNRILKSIQDLYGFKTRVDDLFGKLLVTVFYHFELHDLIFVGLAGLSNNSIDILKELLKKAVEKENYKVVIMTNFSFDLSKEVIVTKL